MKTWQESEELLAQIVQGDGRCALATIVRIQGSTYRRPGARLLIESSGVLWGNISGGCLEEDVREHALQAMQTGEPRMVHYDTSDIDDQLWGMGLGCDGQVDLILQPLGPDHARWLTAWRNALAGERLFAVATVTDGPDRGGSVWFQPGQEPVSVGLSPTCQADVLERMAQHVHDVDGPSTRWDADGVFIQRFCPPPTLLICGAGDDARALCTCASQVGFRVVVADHRGAYLTSERFPAARRLIKAVPGEVATTLPAHSDTWVVIKTHTLTHDKGWVKTFLETSVPYIGLLGPRARRDDIFQSVGLASQARIYGPVGLDLGAEGAEQVAISIVAEILALRAGRVPRHLRDRKKAIHAD